MKKKNKAGLTTRTIVLSFVPVVIFWVALSIFILFSPTTKLIDNKRTSWFVTYTDQIFKGNTQADVKKLESILVFRYELKKGYDWPYAGVCIIPRAGFINSSNNNTVYITLRVRNSKIIPILLNEYVPGHTDTIRNTGFRSWSYDLKIIPGKEWYQIPLADFKTPAYWEKENEGSNQWPEFNPAMIRNVCIQNCILLGLNEPEEVLIQDFNFERKFTSWIWGGVIFSACWILGNIGYWFFMRKRNAVFIPYVATEVLGTTKDDWENIQTYISAHYMEELDMDLLEKELGIARHKIAALIKEKTSLLFKQYLNQIRVAEAKRLLQKTDLPIGEIADQAGFGHISNFNRVFKEYTGQSPSDLRRDINAKL